MNVFYTDRIEGDFASLPEAEAGHLGKVLRKKVGDQILLIDGRGGRYQGEIIDLHKKTATVKILERTQDPLPRASLHLAIAPTKNISRLEWLFEKATEIGIDTIWPILSFHSERKVIKPDRLEKILLSATKQSLKSFLPVLHPIQTFEQFLENQVDQFSEEVEKYIAYIDPSIKMHLYNNYSAGNDVVILVGPEGGFSAEEAKKAMDFGFMPVSLGPHRLRTETAGLVATTIVQLKNQVDEKS